MGVQARPPPAGLRLGDRQGDNGERAADGGKPIPPAQIRRLPGTVAGARSSVPIPEIDWAGLARYMDGRPEKDGGRVHLTATEWRVLRRVFEDWKFADIAREFERSEDTVESHWREIKRKTGIGSQVGAVHWVYTHSRKASGGREGERPEQKR